MAGLFGGIKKGIYDTYTAVSVKVKGVNTNSTFDQDGKLTPEEFEEACEKLIYICPTWTWKPAIDAKHVFPELSDPNKQFISSKITSKERAKNALQNVEITEQADGWIEAKIKEDPSLVKNPELKIDDEKVIKKEVVSQKNMDDSDEETPVPTKKPEAPVPTSVVSGGKNSDVRYYDISITYDRHHHTPRLWLAGTKDNGAPLTNEEIFEDIMSDYANKTVTIESHPHLGTSSIHPCKHAQVIHQLVTEAKGNGINIGSDQALSIFMKFMNSVLPTLEFDYSTEVTLK